MKTLIGYLDELDSLLHAARGTGAEESEKFAAEFCNTMTDLYRMLGTDKPSDAFLDADQVLTEAVKRFGKNPDSVSVRAIKGLLACYRSAATSQ